jgi:hypothetical protein
MKLNATHAGIVSLHALSYTDRALFYFEFKPEVANLCTLKLCANRADED